MVLPEEIQSELKSAHEALNDGNEGKARVCARRAVGKAFQISKYSGEVERFISAHEIVKLVARSNKFPAGIREAATRLSASVLEEIISKKPIDDALLIIETLLS